MSVCCSTRNPTNKDCCAESESCLITSDNFNRTDSTNLGVGWCEISGDWEIDNNQLNCLSEGIVLTTARQPPPTITGRGFNTRIVVDLVIPSSGDATYKIITAYRTSSDYNWVKLHYNSTTNELTPTFYSTAGTGSVVMDTTTNPAGELWFPAPDTNFTMEFCNSNVEWVVTNVGTQGDVIWQCCEPCGLESLPASRVGGVGFLLGRFDNFSYHIHWESQPECDRCQCMCDQDEDDYACIPEDLKLTVVQNSPGTYTCPCIDGLELDLTQSDPDISGTDPVYNKTSRKDLWFSETFTCEGSRMWFILKCMSGTYATLSIVDYPTKDPTVNAANYLFFPTYMQPRDEESSTCFPYSQVFHDLETEVTTCDLLDENETPIGTGTRPRVCTDCGESNPDPMPIWTVYVTES